MHNRHRSWLKSYKRKKSPLNGQGYCLKKLLQEFFLEQLDALQALDQLVPLTATNKHLPGNIINILSHLRKVDNIPFNQLYSLTEDCVDRYYIKKFADVLPPRNKYFFTPKTLISQKLLIIDT